MSSVLPSTSIQMARSLGNVSSDEVHQMSAWDLFTSQMESGSTEAATDAMKKLRVVCVLGGPEHTRTVILPYLSSLLNDNNGGGLSDELSLILGQQISTILPILSEEALIDILPILEKLACTEETVVRDQAVSVMNEVSARTATSAAAAAIIHTHVALVKRLASAEWFTAKVSAAGIFASIFQLAKNSQSQQFELLTLYKELIADETPMVRRAAAQHLGKTIQAAGWNFRDFGATAVTALAKDEQDSVRLLAVASLAHVGDEFGQHPTWTVQHWLPILKDGTTDMSWRVRNNLAKHFSNVATALGIAGDRRYPNEQNLVLACFVAMLTDQEAEVRASAVGHLARMVNWGGPGLFATHLQPLLPALADDVVMEVRSKCALAIMDAAHSGTLDDGTILQAFGPLLESFLQDEFHEVQLQVLSNLHKVAHLLPGLPGVVSTLLQMSKAANWRVREAVAKLLPHLAEARGLDFFHSVLLDPAWLTLLLDPVANVRNSIVAGMPLLVRTTGPDFVKNVVLPQHVKIYNQHANTYLIRMTILRAHVETAVAVMEIASTTNLASSEPLFHDVLVQILRGLHDKVPNVRMVAAQGLGRILQADTGDFMTVAQIQPAIEKRMAEEDDVDCRQACQEAMEKVK